ncbi:dihydrofolate reductase [Acidaminobacter sp. JC074]|uniref:NAD(P)-dependent oxidoreductase n=1 Tax=Acidaminobacter sp. JC074 TaxID=2530199 RepID=UPI001F0CE921|nr:NAD(P)-dependent oxidoreductase [Acidaminobacter sp. JC074]MCH4889453.1 dihydrofolate reductase [Acidaminobacter sp. JC074]
MKVLFTYDYGQACMDELRALGMEVVYFDEKRIDEYKDIEDVEVLVCYKPFEKIDLHDYKSLKLILLSSIGFDQLPKDHVKEIGITVCNNRGGYSIPMGEWIVMKLLEMVKHSKAMYENQNKKTWKPDTGILEIYQKKIVFFGTGTISKEAAKRLAGFGVDIVGLNTSGHSEEFFSSCHPLSQAEAVVKDAAAVVVALPLTDSTRGIVGKKILDAMDENAVLINIARGEVVDEPYLVEVLREKKIKAAALDVFYEEPLPKEHPLWDLDNVVITCHNSWISEKRNSRRFDLIKKNLIKYQNKEQLLNVINILRGY